MIDVGEGTPLVLVPGIQGRWEWMRPAVETLARRCRVLTFSLAGEPGAVRDVDPPARAGSPRAAWSDDREAGFNRFVKQVDRVLDAAGVERAAICGVSYGGLIAVRYAAVRPERVSALLLVSAVGPSWRPDTHIERYVRAPRLMAPAFVLTAPLRLWPEIIAAIPGRRARARFVARHTARVTMAPISPVRMSERVRLSATVDFVTASRSVRAPTLVVTGEANLDRVVPVAETREYLALIAGARLVTFEGTGHIGLMTRPEEFAEIVGGFLQEVVSSQ